MLLGIWSATQGLHWGWKLLIAAPIVVTGAAAISTIMGTTQVYTRAWVGELPAANRYWTEREIGELKLVSMNQELYFCQQQQVIWDQKLKQAQYDKSRGQRGYIDDYIRSLIETMQWNSKVINHLLQTKAPSSQYRCK